VLLRLAARCHVVLLVRFPRKLAPRAYNRTVRVPSLGTQPIIWSVPRSTQNNLPTQRLRLDPILRNFVYRLVWMRYLSDYVPVPVSEDSHSRRTWLAALSGRKPTNFESRSLFSAVHSTNWICTTISGLVQIISFISSALTPPPHRDDPSVGKSTKGQCFTCNGFSFRTNSLLTCGTSPARTLAANRKSFSSKYPTRSASTLLLPEGRYPPMTNSCCRSSLSFCQLPDRSPASYLEAS
jgi:hypothetical protein